MTDAPELSEMIALKMTPQFLELIDKLANDHHMNRSRFIRYVIREFAERKNVRYNEEILYEST